jgi:hypothetical protein
MTNPWSKFQSLIEGSPVLIGDVTAHNGDGTSTLTMPGGGALRAMGQGVAVGSKAFVRDNQIAGGAPNLPTFNLEV